MANELSTGNVSVANDSSPPWPNDQNWSSIVNTHNKNAVDGELLRSASWSITLVMICSALGKAIPRTYRLKDRDIKVHTHQTYVQDYAEAVCNGKMPGKGKVIAKPLAIFAEKLGASVRSICERLMSVMSSEKTDGYSSTINHSATYVPTRDDFESAYRTLSQPGQDVPIDEILDKIGLTAKASGLLLKDNWRIITERNIEKWAKER